MSNMKKGKQMDFYELARRVMGGEYEIGDEFITDYGSILYVSCQEIAKTNLILKWRSNDTEVAVSRVTVNATYYELKQQPKKEYLPIDLSELVRLVSTGDIDSLYYIDIEDYECKKPVSDIINDTAFTMAIAQFYREITVE